MNPIDPEVLARIKGGDRAAFEQLVRAYDRLVSVLLVDRVGARDDIHDLRQDVFYRVYRGIDTLRDPSKLSPWIRGICRNVVREYWSSRARSPVSLEGAVEPVTDSSTDEKDASVAHSFTKAMRLLPARYREVLRLRYYAGMDYEEIAETLGLTLTAVDALMRRAKARLKDAVTPILEREDLR